MFDHPANIDHNHIGTPSGGERLSADVFAAVVAPDFYQQNPFRQTGLSVLAGTRVVAKRLDALRQTLELGTAEYRWAFAPAFAPSAEQLTELAQTLRDPRRRFACEFFWFWPESYPEESADEAIGYLANGEVDAALRCWRRAEAAGSAVATHNLAVYYHLEALGGERIWNAEDAARGVAWAGAFARWCALEPNADFWARVESRLRQLDEPQLPPSIVEGLRATLPQALVSINGELVLRYARSRDMDRAGWHAVFLHAMLSSVESGLSMLEKFARPLSGQLKLRLAAAEDAARAAPADSLEEIIRLIDPEPPELELIDRLCGRNSAYVLDLRSAFASTVLDRLVLYQRETHDNAACLPWLERLQEWPLKPELQARIQDVHAIIGQLTETMFHPEPQSAA